MKKKGVMERLQSTNHFDEKDLEVIIEELKQKNNSKGQQGEKVPEESHTV